MIILIISSHAPALVGFRKHLISNLILMGHSVIAMAPNHTPETREVLTDIGAMPSDFKMQRANINPVYDIFATLQLVGKIKSIKPDITLAFFIKPVIFGTTAAWFARVPRRISMVEGLGYVFTASADRITWKRIFLKYIVGFLYRVAFTAAHRVVFLNPDDQSEFVSAKLLKKEKSYLLGGIGVDLNEWQKQAVPRGSVRFLLAARLLREKGVLEYAAAAKIIKSKYPEVKFFLLGEVDDNPGSITRAEAQAWVDEGILEWPGYVRVLPWLAQSSVFVLPSYREGVPLSSQEALAVGRAIITTDVPGCRQTVINGVNGFLIPARDVNALAASMERFVISPDLISIMGQESRRLAEERFDVIKVNQRLISLILDEKNIDDSGVK